MSETINYRPPEISTQEKSSEKNTSIKSRLIKLLLPLFLTSKLSACAPPPFQEHPPFHTQSILSDEETITQAEKYNTRIRQNYDLENHYDLVSVGEYTQIIEKIILFLDTQPENSSNNQLAPIKKLQNLDQRWQEFIQFYLKAKTNFTLTRESVIAQTIFQDYNPPEILTQQAAINKMQADYLNTLGSNKILYDINTKKHLPPTSILLQSTISPKPDIATNENEKNILDLENTLNNLEIMEANRQAMLELEIQKPGSVLYLHQNYGIINFYRYRPYDLIRQYQLAHNPQNRLQGYVLFQTATSDWNLRFNQIDTRFTHHQVSNLGSNYAALFMEMGNLDDYIKHTNTITQKFGPADIIIISGHGFHDHIKLSHSETETKNATLDFTIPDFLKKSSLLHNFVKKNGQVILNSCSTGNPETINGQSSFAAQLSQAIPDTTISAPVVDTNHFELKLEVKDDRLLAHSYARDFRLDEVANQQRHYQNGTLISQDIPFPLED